MIFDWATEHPFLTFILLLAILDTISNIFGRKDGGGNDAL